MLPGNIFKYRNSTFPVIYQLCTDWHGNKLSFKLNQGLGRAGAHPSSHRVRGYTLDRSPARLTQRSRKPFTSVDNLESPTNRSPLTACL